MIRTLLAALLFAAVGATGPGRALAQDYPNRPIKVVVPFPAGGPTDAMARIVSDRLGAVLGQSIVVENRGGGAGGSVGAKFVVASDPDGYTILLTPGGSLTTGPAVHKNIGYDPQKAFTPVGLLMECPQILSVQPSLPVKTLPEFIAYAKANPGKISFGSQGFGVGPQPALGTAQARNRHQHGARALSRNRPDAGRHADRRNPGGDRSHHHEPGACPVGEDAAARHCRPDPHAQAARRADNGRGGLCQDQFAVLARRRGPGRHPRRPSSTSSMPHSATPLAQPEAQARLGTLGAEIKIGTPAAFGKLMADELALWNSVVASANIKGE